MKPTFTALFGTGLSALPFITRVMALPVKSDVEISDRPDWAGEKDDILERAAWLVKEIDVAPDALIRKMPEAIGEEYRGEWAIYCCSMLCHGLANISRLYPETKPRCMEIIPQLIDIVNTPEIRAYDTRAWGEDAILTLKGRKSHMTYLSILSWMITDYRLLGGDSRYDTLLHGCCEALVRRMKESRFDLNLLSFPRKQIFIADMLVAIVALRNYGRLFGGQYKDVVEAWLRNAKDLWTMPYNGLLAATLPGESRYARKAEVRGSSAGLNCSYLTLIDPAFASDQYRRMMRRLYGEAEFKGEKVYGIREYERYNPDFKLKPGDAGMVIKGLSCGGTAFALGAATYLGDWTMRSKILRTADLAGGTVRQGRMRHYRMGEIFMVGEATMLAMRTNIPW